MWESFKELLQGTAVAVGFLLWACLIMGLVALGGWGVYAVFETTKSSEQLEAERQYRIEQQTPRVYSKVDGCTVYIWNNDSRNHYFTKCDNSNKVVTESSWRESCGKACSKTIVEKIETINKE